MLASRAPQPVPWQPWDEASGGWGTSVCFSQRPLACPLVLPCTGGAGETPSTLASAACPGPIQVRPRSRGLVYLFPEPPHRGPV